MPAVQSAEFVPPAIQKLRLLVTRDVGHKVRYRLEVSLLQHTGVVIATR